MLVLLGGFLGNGRLQLANRISKMHGVHLYDTRSQRVHGYLQDSQGRVSERAIRAGTDDLRIMMYRRMLTEFPVLSKMYPDMIISDILHREKPRTFLIEHASQYFDKIVFIWVDSNEKRARKRLVRMAASHKFGATAELLKYRERTIREFEPPGPEVPVYTCDRVTNEAAEELWQLIRRSSE